MPKPYQYPKPETIKQARIDAKLSQTVAASLIQCSRNAWQQWEKGSRKMHPAFFELWILKTNHLRK